jgi:hypothetical protein
MAQQPPVGQGLLIVEASRSHSFRYSSGRVISPTQRPLIIDNTHKRQISMPPAGFKPTIPQTHALDRAATGIGTTIIIIAIIIIIIIIITEHSSHNNETAL